MRMFPGGLSDLIKGWTKGAVSGAGNTPRAALLGVSLWLSGLIMAAVGVCIAPLVCSEVAIVLGVLYGLWVLQLRYLFRNAGTFSFLSALFFPVGWFFYQFVFFRALAGKRSGQTTEWKGRHVG